MITLRWPLPNNCTKITTKFGELQKNPAGEWVPHAGIDISCAIGTPVYAAHAGTVRYEWTQKGGWCMPADSANRRIHALLPFIELYG
jgi:murein DD-endopeptidase MepM/ murein hydrolase activator NlpD